MGQATRRIRHEEVSAASDSSLCWVGLAKGGHPFWAAPVLSHGLLYVRGGYYLLCLELIPPKK